jgi:peptidoglycan/xylan/chitin deacetylase (PgdA/CDA1 family)
MPGHEKAIYLTFDDGPHPDTTPRILDILETYDARATFFCVGENVNKHPDTYASILDAGHAVGNHTYNHLKGWETETAYYIRNAQKCGEVVNSKLFRPPYGKIKRSQKRMLRQDYEIIMWTVLSRDYDPKVDVETCLGNTWKRTVPGAIVLFHDSVKTAAKLKLVLPEYLSLAREAGYTFKVLGARC